MFEQELFGIKLFDYEEAQPYDAGTQYINVINVFTSLKKYDGLPFEVTMDWEITVWSIEGQVIDRFSVLDISEFKLELLKKIG